VHAEAGGGVDLADRRPGLLVGPADVGTEEIDPADIEADGLDRAHRHFAVVRVNDVGHVDRRAPGREVGGGPQIDRFACRRHAVLGQPLLFQQLLGLPVELDAGQDLLVPDAAARVAVHLFDQLLDALPAVTHDVPGNPLGDGDQLAVDHQHAVIEAHDKGLDDDAPAVLEGVLEGGLDVLAALQIDRDAAPVVGVQRLDDDGIADALGRPGGRLAVIDQVLARHRQAEVGEDLVGLLLVGGQFHRDLMGLASDRRLDAPLIAAVAELDQAALVEADPGDVALARRLDQGRGAGPQLPALGEADEIVALFLEIEIRRPVLRLDQVVGQQVVQQGQRQAARFQADLLLLVLVDHVVDAGLAVAPGLAEGHVGPREVLHLDRAVLPDVAHPGAFVLAQAAQETARLAVGTAVLPQARQGFQQRLDETIAQAAGRPVLQHADVHPVADHGEEGIDVRPPIDRRFEDLHFRAPCRLPAAGRGLGYSLV
jgi:hypothetical protein